MATPWEYDGTPEPVGTSEITLMEGTTFCISDESGDIGTHQPAGLFVRDTRVLSRWRLLVDGQPLNPLRAHLDSPHSVLVLARALSRTGDLVVMRWRHVGDGMREEVIVHNTTRETRTTTVQLDVDADFADLFEVKEARAPVVDVQQGSTAAGLDLSLDRDGNAFGVEIRWDRDPRVDGRRLSWSADIPAHGSWSVVLEVVPSIRGIRIVPSHPRDLPAEVSEPARRRADFYRSAPGLVTGSANLANVLQHCIEDLATLRVFDTAHPDLPVIAAGAPWFMALFGRDSLLTSMMLMVLDPSLAVGTLTVLGEHQGVRTDPVTEEQPGRILHELRFGPSGTLALGGSRGYYGSVDATPLFVVAVGELLRWHPHLVTDDMRAQVDRALQWMTTLADPDGDGFLEYARSTSQGLVNQGWKDSWDGINFADGTLAEPPIALAEVQGYAYAAYLARAAIAEFDGDDALGGQWRHRADRLSRAFDEAFWLPDSHCYATGLDRGNRPIDSVTSSIGHLLWSGIVRPERASDLAAHLVSSRLFSGWGVRTLATDMGAYNPMSYHNGSVWPHDTALCVAGLTRYGFRQEAEQIAAGLLDAAHHFGGRLPELFAGFSREQIPVPVPYPAACAPQAWAAAAPVQLLRSLLGLEPSDDGVRCDAQVPASLLPLKLTNVRSNGGLYDIDAGAAGTSVSPSPTG